MGWSTPLSHGINASSTSPITLTLDSTGADFGVIGVCCNGGITVATVTDNKGNTWSSDTFISTGIPLQLWYLQGGTFGTGHTVTVTFAGGTPFASIVGAYFSGSLASPFDSPSTHATSSAQPGSKTPAQAGELFIGLVSQSSGGSVPTVDSGFSVLESNGGGTFGVNFGLTLAYLINTGSGAENPTYSSANGTNYLAAFKGTPTTDVSISGVSTGGSPGTLTPSVAANASGAHSGGAAGTVSVASGPAISGVNSGASAGSVSVRIDTSVSISGVSAGGSAGTLAISNDVNISVVGVSSAAVAGIALANTTAPPVVGVSAMGVAGSVVADFPDTNAGFPVITIMRNRPLASVGAMRNTAIANIGKLRPSGPEPKSVAINIVGVSSGAVVIPVRTTNNLLSNISGVSSGAVANAVTVSIT